MNMINYKKAKKYAKKLRRVDSLDLVHDAYLVYHSRTGKDLFDEPIGRIFKIIQTSFHESINKTKHQGGGSNHKRWTKRKFISKPYATYRHFSPFNEERVNNVTPLDICIANDLERAYKGLYVDQQGILRDILILKGQGYKNIEISSTLDISKQLVGYYLKQVDLGIILN